MLAAANAFFLNAAVLAGPIEPGAGEPPPGSDGVVTVVKWVAWTVFALGVIGVLVTAGAMMFNNRRGQGGEHAAALGWVCAGCILASAAVRYCRYVHGLKALHGVHNMHPVAHLTHQKF